jgi:rod shape-determining protein MreC
MWKKIIFILLDFYEYLLFLFLIIISLLILFVNEVPQTRALQGEIADVFTFIHYPRMWINQLSGLIEENENLRRENLQLRLQNVEFKEAFIENQRLRAMLNMLDSTKYDLLPAKVINKGTTPIVNSILLNVGSRQGVKPNMAVISTRGIVGKTIAVGDRTTQVQLFLDANFRLSVKFQNSRVAGIMKWYPDGRAEVKEIPITVTIDPGELVITSGYSKIYPPDIVVGEVIEVNRPEHELFQSVIVHSRVDTDTIEEVFIILDY